MALGAVSLNMFWNPAIRGSGFLQASMKGIHTYAGKLKSVNILGKTNFVQANRELKSIHNWMGKIEQSASKIKTLENLSTKKTRDNLKEQLRLQKGIAEREKQASYHQGKRQGQKRYGKNGRSVSGGAVVASAFAMAPLVLPLKSGVEFESKMLRVKALSGATAKDFKMLEKSALNLGATTEWKAGQVAEGMQYLTMAGFKPKETVQAMPGLLNLATAGELDLKSTSDIASNIMGSFKIKADKMGMVSDILAKTITTANVDIKMLGDSLKYSAPIAKKAGMSLAETSAMTGLLGNIGIQGSMAGTSMKSILTRLASPPTESKKILKALNIQTSDKDGNLKNIPSLLQEVYDKTKSKGTGTQLGIMKKIFGLEPLAGGAELIDLAGKGELQKYIGIVNNYEGTAKKIADIQLSGTAGRLKLLGSAMEGLSISFSKNLLPLLTRFIETLTSGLNSLTSWSKENQTLSSVLYGTAIALGVGVVALTAFGFAATMMGTGFAALSGGFTMVGGAIAFMGRALLMNPIGLTLTAIATAGYLIYDNWEFLKQKAGEIWTSIVNAIKHPFETYFKWIETKFNNMIKLFKQVKGLLGLDAPNNNQTLSQRQAEKGVGLALQVKPVNSVDYNPNKKIGSHLKKGFSLADQLNMEKLPVESPSVMAQNHIASQQAKQVTNNNMQQTHVTNNVTINNQGGKLDQHEFDRAFQTKLMNDKHHASDVTFNDPADVAS